MLDTGRDFSACILCGSAPTTKEHIFGDALSKNLMLPRRWEAEATSTHSELDGKLLKGRGQFTSETGKVLCAACNTNLLGPLMQRVTPIVTSIAYGEAIHLDAGDVDDLRRYLERLAIIQDVLTSDFDISEEAKASGWYRRSEKNRRLPPVLTASERLAWRDGRPLTRARVFLGVHDGVLGLVPESVIRHGYFPFGRTTGLDQPLQRRKRVVLVLRRLAVVVELNWQSTSPEDRASANLVELGAWDRVWPIEPRFGYDDFYSLLEQTPQVVAERLLHSDPRFIAFVEAKMREEDRRHRAEAAISG